MIIGGTGSTTELDTATQAGADAAKLNDDLNQFLNLLVTQLQNQDPLDPMDANEFTSQLVQFASVEQQIYQNSNLEKLLNVQQTSQVATMVDFIGNTVETVGNQVPLENGAAKFTYELAVNSNDTTITIQNSSGLTVFTADGETASGKHELTWDGTNAYGTAQDPGAYTVIVSAQDYKGNIQDVKQTVFGRVTGAGAEDGVVSLYLGDVTSDLDKVLAVSETTKTVN